MLIFLDFDGVLRREASALYQLEANLLSSFEAVVRMCPTSNIVITSSWRHAFGLNELRGQFSDDIAARIEGVTPTSHDLDGFYRHREVLAYLKRYHSLQTPWLAIDDDPEHYPLDAPVLLTDAKRGFDSFAATELTRRIELAS